MRVALVRPAHHSSQLSPALALLTTHDLLLAKRGIAASKDHAIVQAINRHKARLTAEFTRARIKSGQATNESWKRSLEEAAQLPRTDASGSVFFHPRWVRINSLRSTLARECSPGGAFVDWTEVESMAQLQQGNSQRYLLDEHIFNLVATPPGTDLTKTQAYREGRIILQDKASCFPATLLEPQAFEGDIIDGCAAPGNKTTHLAALAFVTPGCKSSRTVYAVERDRRRSDILQKMVKLAEGVDEKGRTVCLGGQDFSKLNPLDDRWKGVEAILLDPSCSGSGIVGRDQGQEIAESQICLPRPSGEVVRSSGYARSKKRKRADAPDSSLNGTSDERGEGDALVSDDDRRQRLSALSTFQYTLLLHAFAFPSARRVAYSTCSVHAEENEKVVVRALQSALAQERGWSILRRADQITGMKDWHIRGDAKAVHDCLEQGSGADSHAIAEACIRCHKLSSDGTMGFFTAAFVRDGRPRNESEPCRAPEATSDYVEDEFEGFSDAES